jgi:hypothetical protein
MVSDRMERMITATAQLALRALQRLLGRGIPTGLVHVMQHGHIERIICSSSVTPGVPWANIETLLAGLRHCREQGRGA